MNTNSIVRLYTKEDVHNFIRSVWKTDVFREQHNVFGSYVWKIVEQYAELPRFVFEMSDPKLEWAHFSTWWGGIPFREYDNPYIHDLYWIHEMAHAGSMVYMPDMNFENFLRKMTDNELHASVVSEVEIYFQIEGLRDFSFTHDIYADKFLNDKAFVRRYRQNPTLTFEEMKVRRRNTMMDANPKNVSDFWIHRFYTQNAAWGACWAHSFDKVENAMYILRNTISRADAYDVNGGLTRKRILDVFIDDFLTDNMIDSIPFKREAEAFAGVYWANRGHYDDAMKKESS